jgi:hypothetical protein
MDKNSMNKKQNLQVLVTRDAANPSRFLAEVKPSDGTAKSRRHVGSRIEVTRFADEHGADMKAIVWNGLFDHLPDHNPQRATAQQ